MGASSTIAAVLIFGLSVQSASAQSRISIEIAGEAYGGAPAFQIRMGDQVVGEGVAEKAIDTEIDGRLFGVPALTSYLEQFDFEILSADFDPTEPISIILTNDRYTHIGDGYDRNLFIGTVSVNGIARSGSEIKIIEYGSVEIDVPLHQGFRPLYGSGQVAIAAPPATGWPTEPDARLTDVAVVPLPLPRPQFDQ